MASEDAPVTISEALRGELDRRQESQKAAAESIGVRQQTFSDWAAGRSRPGRQNIAGVAKYLRRSQAEVQEMWKRSTPDLQGQLDTLEGRVQVLEGLIRMLLDGRAPLGEER